MKVGHQAFFFNEEELPWVVNEKIISLLAGGVRIFLLYGPLGVGKTALVKEFARKLGVKEAVKSPTFGYVNCYNLDSATTKSHIKKLCHFDLYRLSGSEDFIASGFDEYIASLESLVVIEWPKIIEPIVLQECYAGQVCKVTLGYDSLHKNKRKMRIEADR